jgi:hypothetical protein
MGPRLAMPGGDLGVNLIQADAADPGVGAGEVLLH